LTTNFELKLEKEAMEANISIDGRRREREQATIPVGLVSKGGEVGADGGASTVNISLSGLRVRTKLPLVPKQTVGIVIDGQFSWTVQGRVVWVLEDAATPWKTAGIKFVQ
jgi:hypothetical protein